MTENHTGVRTSQCPSASSARLRSVIGGDLRVEDVHEGHVGLVDGGHGMLLAVGGAHGRACLPGWTQSGSLQATTIQGGTVTITPVAAARRRRDAGHVRASISTPWPGTTPTRSSGSTARRCSPPCGPSARCCGAPSPRSPGFGQGPGYWSLSRYADVMEVSRNPQRFISGAGTNIPDMPVEIAEFFGSMINMDAPRHTRLRLIVNRLVHAPPGGPHRGAGAAQGRRHRRPGGRHGRVRLRHRDRRQAPARDHLRHDGHPAVGVRRGSSSSPTSSWAPATPSTRRTSWRS